MSYPNGIIIISQITRIKRKRKMSVAHTSRNVKPYSVVLTLEGTGAKSHSLTLYAVPSHWKQNDRVFFPVHLPKKTVEGYLEMGRNAPHPEKKWKSYAYIEKAAFSTLEQANAYVRGNESGATSDSDSLVTLREAQKKMLQKKKRPVQDGQFEALFTATPVVEPSLPTLATPVQAASQAASAISTTSQETVFTIISPETENSSLSQTVQTNILDVIPFAASEREAMEKWFQLQLEEMEKRLENKMDQLKTMTENKMDQISNNMKTMTEVVAKMCAMIEQNNVQPANIMTFAPPQSTRNDDKAENDDSDVDKQLLDIKIGTVEQLAAVNDELGKEASINYFVRIIFLIY